MKMTFKAEHYDYSLYGEQSKKPISTIIYDTQHDSLDMILEDFTQFLRGCGFYINGYLDVVPYDDVEEIRNEESINE